MASKRERFGLGVLLVVGATVAAAVLFVGGLGATFVLSELVDPSESRSSTFVGVLILTAWLLPTVLMIVAITAWAMDRPRLSKWSALSALAVAALTLAILLRP